MAADKRHANQLANLGQLEPRARTWGNAKSDRTIAAQLGCNDSTVFRVRQVLHLKHVGRIKAEVDTSINLPSRVTGKDGTSYVTKVKQEAQVITGDNLPSRSTGKDGKSYPATRKAKAPVIVEAQ